MDTGCKKVSADRKIIKSIAAKGDYHWEVEKQVVAGLDKKWEVRLARPHCLDPRSETVEGSLRGPKREGLAVIEPYRIQSVL